MGVSQDFDYNFIIIFKQEFKRFLDIFMYLKRIYIKSIIIKFLAVLSQLGPVQDSGHT